MGSGEARGSATYGLDDARESGGSQRSQRSMSTAGVIVANVKSRATISATDHLDFTSARAMRKTRSKNSESLLVKGRNSVPPSAPPKSENHSSGK
jgi:hypothetical protein